jgi:hypothetical protein
LHIELMQTGMPVFAAGAGQMLSHWPQFIGSCIRSRQPIGQLVCPVGQVAQSVPAVLQPFGHCMVAGVHVPLALHVPCRVSTPFAHDCAAPHSVPAPLLPDSTHIDVPVVHDVRPVLHAFAGWQATAIMHDMHIPVLQTRFMPHPVPSEALAPVSLQVGVPLEQLSVPV